MNSLKKLFDAEAIVKGTQGFLGEAYGSLGKDFGKAGGKFGIQGADNLPKYDHNDYFNVASYFQLDEHFNPDKLWDADAVLAGEMKF